jgi:hypothetical protein
MGEDAVLGHMDIMKKIRQNLREGREFWRSAKDELNDADQVLIAYPRIIR